VFSKVVANLLVAVSLGGFCSSVLTVHGADFTPSARVLVVEHPTATQAFSPQFEPVQRMVAEGLAQFTGKPKLSEAWLSLVSTQDVIGIKVHSAPGPMSGTRPVVVAAIVESLLASGFSPGRIVIWDKRAIDLRLVRYHELAEKYQVSIAGALEESYDPAQSYPSSILGKLVYGDLEFGRKGEGIGRNSYVTKLLTRRITKIVNVTPLLNHNQAGVSGALFTLAMASVDNTLRFEDLDRLATAVPEIYALPDLADRVVLNIVDALICQYRGEERSYLQYSTALNQLWFSRDPVAVDALALLELDRNRRESKPHKSTLQIYANAALMDLGVADTNQIKVERLELR
jgi:hypothetical protein